MTSPPLVIWCGAMIASIRENHCSAAGQVGLDVAPVPVRAGQHPRRDAAPVGLRVDVRPWPCDHVQPGLLRHVEELVHVPDAGEVVPSRRGRAVVPVEVHGDRVVAIGPHLLQVIEPQAGRRRAPGVELARGDEDRLAVDLHRVLVIGDRPRRAEQHVLRLRDRSGGDREGGRGLGARPAGRFRGDGERVAGPVRQPVDDRPVIGDLGGDLLTPRLGRDRVAGHRPGAAGRRAPQDRRGTGAADRPHVRRRAHGRARRAGRRGRRARRVHARGPAAARPCSPCRTPLRCTPPCCMPACCVPLRGPRCAPRPDEGNRHPHDHGDRAHHARGRPHPPAPRPVHDDHPEPHKTAMPLTLNANHLHNVKHCCRPITAGSSAPSPAATGSSISQATRLASAPSAHRSPATACHASGDRR